MFYYYRTLGADFWNIMVKMIDENYAHEEDPNSVLIMGLYQFRTAEQLRQDLNISPNTKLIVYQLEPLISKHISPPFTLEKMIDCVRGYDEVWDYDLQNIEVLKQHGINAKFRPIKYTQSLKQIPKNEKQDIDVLFYGSPTKDRCNFFIDFTSSFVTYTEEDAEIYSNKMNIVTLWNIQDYRLDEYISRSKIILNLLPNVSETRQQQSRIFYPLINEKCVLSQKCPINYFGDCILEFNNFQDFGEKAITLLKTGDWKNYPLRFESYKKFLNRETNI